MRLSDFVRESRLNNGLSQEQLARKLDLSYVAVSKVENGHGCGMKVLRALSDFTDTPIAKLREMLNEDYE